MKKKKKDAVMTAIFGGVGKVMSGIVDGLSDQNVLCGTYADGTPRSFIDALRGDYISPEKKKKILKKLLLVLKRVKTVVKNTQSSFLLKV